VDSIFWAIVIGLALVGIFITTYLLNKNTPVPEGCEPNPGCEGCQITSCVVRKDNKEVNV
jgi:hypothetical protein